MEKWYHLMSTDKNYEAEIIKGKLEENQVPVMLVNKKDSSYVFLGEVEIYVPFHLKDIARELIGGSITN